MSTELAKVDLASKGPIGKLLAIHGDSIRALCSRHLDADQVTRLALLAQHEVKGLAECTPASLLSSLMKAAKLGLEFNTPLQHAFLVPRSMNVGTRDNPRWEQRASLDIGYRGYLSLIYRSPLIASVSAYVVHEGERFEVHQGTSPRIEHRPDIDADEDENIIAAYAVAQIRGSAVCPFVVMGRKTLAKIQAASNKGGKDSPAYKFWLGEMLRKAPIRRLAKQLPLTGEGVEAARAIALANAYEDDPDALVEVEAPDAPKPLTAGARLNAMTDHAQPTPEPVTLGKGHADAEPPADWTPGN